MNSLNDFLFIEDFYFHKEILIRSLEGRDLHLLTITSHDHHDPNIEHESLFNEQLFPERVRGLRFLKPVILISARVHPGESVSSLAMNGVIDFLTNTLDLRAQLLRKMFVFMIIPMVNVDGVYHGNFRMDSEGKNLNRYYVKPSPEKQ
jgi:murein tripeptide amidase MpaA